MKNELEICVRCLVSFEELKTKLLDMGFRVQEDFQLNDIYMIKDSKEISLDNADEILSNYVLVRETVGKRIMLVLKTKEFNEKGEIVFQNSVKCKIDNKIDGYNLMTNLGYKKFLELNIHNILLSNGKNEMYIQDVDGLGVFIEMEQKNMLLDNNNGDTLEEMIDNLKKYKLPIDDTYFFVKKSYEMLLKIL